MPTVRDRRRPAGPEVGPRGVEDRRGRVSALAITSLASVLMVAWTGFDLVLEPALAAGFLAVRVAAVVPSAVLAAFLWRRESTRHGGLCVFVSLAAVQLGVAWMLPQVEHLEFYLIGYSLALYASGCLSAARLRWTVALIATTWLALGCAAAASPGALSAADLGAAAFFLATASSISIAAHAIRDRLADREGAARRGLEEEQRRTRSLLAELERLSHEDALTGLANRRRWDAELGAACAAAEAGGPDFAVLLVDVDHFKAINDGHGHAGGDEVLRAVAALLTGRVRAGDLIARFGGDELAVLLPGADVTRAVDLAEGIRAAAGRLRPPGCPDVPVSLSVGVATAALAGPRPAAVMRAADEQLYRAKLTRNAVGAPAVPAWSGRPAPPRSAPGPWRPAPGVRPAGSRRP